MEIKDINNQIDVNKIFLILKEIVSLIDKNFELKDKLVSFNNVEDVLIWIRICIKYSKFENEAQRREIKYLLNIIERLSNGK